MTLEEAKKLSKLKEQSLFSKEELKINPNSYKKKSFNEIMDEKFKKKGNQKK